jgi:uncharacterized protein YndB with AHSA1/START domain
MGQITTSRTIAAPPERVFAAIADIESFVEINPNITKVEFHSEQRSGVGTRFRETRLMRAKEASSVLEVTEYVPHEHVRILSDEGGAVWDTVMSIAPHGEGGSELTMRMEDRPHTLGARLVVPMIRGMIAKAVAEDMDRVKVWCEAEEGA